MLDKGRHPEDHGIVGDFMYDLRHERIFNASDLQSTRMAEWWRDATPFWSTAAKHGKKIAFYNWHDCQLPGAALEDPKDCRPYEAAPNNAHPSKSKIAREFDEGICEIYLHFSFMSLVAHRFGSVGFRFSNICFDFFKCVCLKKTTTKNFKVRHVQIDELPRT